MNRKDKKDDKLASLLRPASKRGADKKSKGKHKDGTATLRARGDAPQPRGSAGKKPRKRGESSETPPSTPLSTETPPVDPQVLPHVDLDQAYDLTADGDDLEALSTDVPELGIGSRVIAPHVRFELEDDALESYQPAAVTEGDVEAQIRALEARLDGLIQGASRGAPAGADAAEPEIEPEAHSAEAIAVESAAELAGSQYYVQKWGRKGLRNRAEEVDEFGLDRVFDAKLRPLLDFVYRRYFRVQTEGIENVPREGRAVVVGNHSGSIPLDGLMLRTALRTDHPANRDLRWLAEDFLFYLPFAGVFMNRAGAVRACQENAERLLSRDNLIAVFPEGVQGIRKLFRDRYRLQRFGRGGYIRLCLRTRAPLIPCAIIGGEEASPLLYRFDTLADLLRIPYLPVTPTFPALGPLGLLPAPTKWRIKFGEPIPFDNYGPEAADDDLLVGRLSERVRSTIQSMLDNGLQQRKSVWL